VDTILRGCWKLHRPGALPSTGLSAWERRGPAGAVPTRAGVEAAETAPRRVLAASTGGAIPRQSSCKGEADELLRLSPSTFVWHSLINATRRTEHSLGKFA
jgi:hypothetical protein